MKGNAGDHHLNTVFGILVAAALLGSGCLTNRTLTLAQGGSYADKTGEVVEHKPKPALYPLVPLAVAVDIPLSPFYVLWVWGRLALGYPLG